MKTTTITNMNNMVRNGSVMVRKSTIIEQLRKYDEALEEAETMEEMMKYTKKITILETMLSDIGMSEEEIYNSYH